MSVRAISWAYGQNLGSASQKAVLLHLAYLAREEDNWPVKRTTARGRT